MTQPCPRCGRECAALTAVVEPEGCFYVCDRCVASDDPANCRECGEPFNNADPTPSGLCAECGADDYDEEMAAERAARHELQDWENGRGV